MPIYTVKPGDTLASIADAFGLSQERIIADNGIRSPDILAVGQALLLRIPAQEYTVMTGDTLSSIAASTGVSIIDLYRRNPLLGGNPELIEGEKLVITYQNQPTGNLRYVNGYTYPSISNDLLRASLPFLSYLTSFSYGFREDGTLIRPDDERLLSTAAEYGVAPVLLLSTLREDGSFSSEKADTLLQNLALQQTLYQSLLSETQSRGFSAVDVDFEYIDPALRAQYAAFIDGLQNTLSPSGIDTFVSLAPKYRADQPGLLYGAHDYALLGAAADRSLLMTYEWGYRKSAPMAVAPINRVREVVQYAISEIPPEKIFLGLPNYGYDWPLPFIPGETEATSLGNGDAIALAAAYGAEIRFDEATQSPYFNYTDENGTSHEVWFEDVRSIAAKCALVREFDLGGVSIWNLMRDYIGILTTLDSEFPVNQVLD